MSRKYNILVTGVGAPGGVTTILALIRKGHNVFGVDMRDNSAGREFCQEFGVVPDPTDPGYAKRIGDLCYFWRIDAILPLTTAEGLYFSACPASQNVTPIISSQDAYGKAYDKWLTLTSLYHNANIGLPATDLTQSEESFCEAVHDLGYPRNKVVIKPPCGNGSRGLRILDAQTRVTVNSFLRDKPDGIGMLLEPLLSILRRRSVWPTLLVQEHIEGLEYSVDCFRGENCQVARVREREEIRSGISFRSTACEDDPFEEVALNIAEHLDLKYAFGFQFIRTDDGEDYLLECNPRVQGTMIATVFGGCDIINAAVQEAMQPGIIAELPQVPDGFKYLRYWGGVGMM